MELLWDQNVSSGWVGKVLERLEGVLSIHVSDMIKINGEKSRQWGCWHVCPAWLTDAFSAPTDYACKGRRKRRRSKMFSLPGTQNIRKINTSMYDLKFNVFACRIFGKWMSSFVPYVKKQQQVRLQEDFFPYITYRTFFVYIGRTWHFIRRLTWFKLNME